MNRTIFLLMCLWLVSCSVTNYSTVPVISDGTNFNVTRIPSANLYEYDETIAETWERTFNRCIQVKESIDKEIDARESRTTSWRGILVGLGGLSGFATLIYGAVKSDPSPEVVGTLGAFSTATLTSYFAFLTDDDRAKELKARSNKLEQLRLNAESQLDILEKMIAEKGILTDLEGKAKKSPEVIEKTKAIEIQILEFRKALSVWDSSSR